MKTIETIHRNLHRSSTLGCCFVAMACWCAPSIAAEIHVPADVPTIQGAINSAVIGDVVVVACGTYVEALQMRNGVALRSATGLPNCVTIEVADGTVAFTADHDEDVDIEGLRVTTSASLARGLVADASSVALRRCEFVGLRTQSTGNFQPGGAAALIRGASTLEVEECLFEDNRHDGVGNVGGGAVRCESSNLYVRSSTFLRNIAIANGGAISALQSGIDLSILEVTGSTFRENRAVFGGGGNLGEGGAIHFNEFDLSGLLVDECIFEANSGHVGGAIRASLLTLENSRFHENWASEGGAVWAFQGSIEDCELWENAAYIGTALRLAAHMNIRDTLFARNRSLEGEADGTVQCRGGSFLNCTFAENQVGGSPTKSAEISNSEGGLWIANTIIAFGVGSLPVYMDNGGFIDVSCCDFYGNHWGDWVGAVAGLNGTDGNISEDPQFCGLRQHEFALQSSSPCAPANSGACGLIGALGVQCSPVHIEESSFGAIRALYR